jgi:hypothetical protein
MKYISFAVFGMLLIGLSLIFTLTSVYHIINYGEQHLLIGFGGICSLVLLGAGFSLLRTSSRLSKNFERVKKEKSLLLYLRLQFGGVRASEAAQHTELTEHEAEELLRNFTRKGITLRNDDGLSEPIYYINDKKIAV